MKPCSKPLTCVENYLLEHWPPSLSLESWSRANAVKTMITLAEGPMAPRYPMVVPEDAPCLKRDWYRTNTDPMIRNVDAA